MTTTSPTLRPTIARLATWLAALALLPAALAAPVAIDAAGIAFSDIEAGDAASAGVDLAYDGGWVVVFGAPGAGALGDAVVAGVHDVLPVDALGAVVIDEALARIALVEHVGDGVAFVLDAASPAAAAASFAAAFEALGGDVTADTTGHVLTVVTASGVVRAVFGADVDGIRVYLGS